MDIELTFLALLIITAITTLFMIPILEKQPPQQLTMEYRKDTKGICYAFDQASRFTSVPCDKVGL